MSTPSGNTGPLGQQRGIGFAILIAIITFGIYSIYWVFKTQEEVKNHSGQGVGGVLGLVIYIVVGVVSWFLIPSEIGKMYKQDGREAPAVGNRIRGRHEAPSVRETVGRDVEDSHHGGAREALLERRSGASHVAEGSAVRSRERTHGP